MARLNEKYRQEVVAGLTEEFGYTNPFQTPRLVKISVNIGVGDATQNIKLLESSQKELSLIVGQHAVTARARKSIAAFKLREGLPIGAFVTLRRDRMWEFFDRLVNVALPRVRDFRGVNPKAFDGQGNYNLGLKEHIIFPEIRVEATDRIKGMNIAIVTTARTDAEGYSLLKRLGMPFRQ